MQYARPASDVYRGDWENQSSASSNIFQNINEAGADDTGYIVSEISPASSVYVTSLGSVRDPVNDRNHVIRYRYKKDSDGGSAIDFTLQLREGYVSEASQGTLIASVFHGAVTSGWTGASYLLSGAEANSITDYTKLFIRVQADQP